MPEQSGLDLLAWLREEDPTLATVIVTAQGEKSLVMKTLNLGGAGFLEKPVVHNHLASAMDKAIAITREARLNRSTREDLDQMSEIDHRLNEQVPEALRDRLRIIYQPMHQIGGDFVNIWYSDASDEVLILIGDVSGHDFRAAYASAYFQGLFRGEVSQDSDFCHILKNFNRRLLNDKDLAEASLSVCGLKIDQRNNRLTTFNCGFPPFYIVDENGFIARSSLGSHPLGWAEALELTPETFSTSHARSLYVFTDGIIEEADNLKIDPLSLLYRMYHPKGSENTNYSNDLLDDVLCLRYYFKNITHMTTTTFEPIINEQYSGAEYVHIDSLQSVWRRSLQYAVGEEMGDRLYDLIICIREVMLNALIHGCAGSSEKFCQLQISYDDQDKVVRVRVDDPGKGHHFDINKRVIDLAKLPDGRQMGLGIVNHLSDDFLIENKGTSVVFDFYINPKQAKH
jgi:anti-sigma regulatory factor (Ser/Thr protein kinase)/CheY-like chemotaxis protein